MPQLEYFVVAESVSIDSNRNSVSVFHILSKLAVEPIPVLSAVAGWIFTQEEIDAKKEYQVRLVFAPPGDEPKIFRVNLNANVRFQNIHLRLEYVPISRVGDFTITLFVDDDKKATHLIEIAD